MLWSVLQQRGSVATKVPSLLYKLTDQQCSPKRTWALHPLAQAQLSSQPAELHRFSCRSGFGIIQWQSQPAPLCHCPAIILTQCGAVSLMACLQAQNKEIAINQLTFITIALEGNYNTKRVLLPAAPTTKYNAVALSCSSIIIIFTRITHTFVGWPVGRRNSICTLFSDRLCHNNNLPVAR